MNKYNTYTQFPDIWISNIPAHWQTHKMKRLFVERSEKGHPNEPLLVASQKVGVVPKNVYGDRTVEAQKDLHLLKLVRIGDFVISLRSFQGGLEYAYYQGIISPAYTILIPHEPMSGLYFRYLAKSKPFIKLLTLCVTGIREGQNIDYTKLKNHLLPIPPRKEQDQIVRFLDWKVSSINKLTAIRKKQIAEFEALRRRIILSAVKHGLNKEVPFKRCEEEWISEMPIHWSLLPIKRLFKIFSGATPQSGNSEYWNGDVVWITPADFKTKDRYIYQGAKNLTDSGFYACSATMIPPNSIIFSKRAPVGTVAINRVNLCTNQGCLSCIPFNDVSSEFFYYAMSVCTEEFERRAAGTTFKEISLAAFGTFLMPVPPINEQLEIVNYLDKLCMCIDLAVRNLHSQIEAFNEIKTRLIADVATGQMDVRNITVPEYEYVEDTADDGCEEESEAKEGLYGEEE